MQIVIDTAGKTSNRPPDLNLLAKLQHSGAATCLIDFTKNPVSRTLDGCVGKVVEGSVNGKVYAVDIGPRTQFEDLLVPKRH